MFSFHRMAVFRLIRETPSVTKLVLNEDIAVRLFHAKEPAPIPLPDHRPRSDSFTFVKVGIRPIP